MKFRSYGLVLVSVAVGAWGCLADDEPSAVQSAAGAMVGQAGASLLGAAGAESQGGAGAVSGTGGIAGEQSVAGSSLNEAGAAGVSETGTPASADPLEVLDGCPEVHVDAHPGQVWAIVVLDLVKSQMVIQNVSGVAQELTTNHQWCSFPKYERLLPLDVDDAGNLQLRVFAPNEILWVNLVEGDVTEGDSAVPIRFDKSGGELALYEAPGTYRDFDRIMAFLSWDEGNPTEGREAVAAGANIWSYRDRIELDPSWGGIVAIGDTWTSEGYATVPLACLPQRQQ